MKPITVLVAAVVMYCLTAYTYKRDMKTVDTAMGLIIEELRAVNLQNTYLRDQVKQLQKDITNMELKAKGSSLRV
jgi:uncharacterized protein YueI